MELSVVFKYLLVVAAFNLLTFRFRPRRSCPHRICFIFYKEKLLFWKSNALVLSVSEKDENGKPVYLKDIQIVVPVMAGKTDWFSFRNEPMPDGMATVSKVLQFILSFT